MLTTTRSGLNSKIPIHSLRKSFAQRFYEHIRLNQCGTFFMKPNINLFGLICFSIAVVFLIGMTGCGAEDMVAFTQVIPANGSTIQTDATIIVTFDSNPTEVNVTGGEFSISGSIVTITGPFTPGTLILTVTWSDGVQPLIYTVEPNIPPAPEGMVLIPAGEFEIGSDDAEARHNEQPVRSVYIDAFYMDKTQVTNTQFKEFLLKNPQWQKERVNARFADENYLTLWDGNDYPDGKRNHPVTNVSWYAAMAYAEWAGKRLPTEAEWEYAARGGLNGQKYPNGNKITPGDANYDRNVGDSTPVALYSENGYGLYDMTGNVWEWCLDKYDAEFYLTFSRDGVTRNPLSGAISVEWLIDNSEHIKGSRVLRGGSWDASGYFTRIAMRVGNPPTFTGVNLDSRNLGFRAFGFRCVKSVTP